MVHRIHDENRDITQILELDLHHASKIQDCSMHPTSLELMGQLLEFLRNLFCPNVLEIQQISIKVYQVERLVC